MHLWSVNQGAAAVSDALFVGQMLMDRKVFRHVVDKNKPFLNEFLFYRFIDDNDKAKDTAPRTLSAETQQFANDVKKWEAIVTLFRSNVRFIPSKAFFFWFIAVFAF